MKSRYLILLIFVALTGLAPGVNAATQNWDMAALWGISEAGFDSAITAARNHFLSKPNDTIIVNIAAGTHDITGADGISIDLGNDYLKNGDGRLIFQGAGMDETVLVFSDTDETQIDGNNVAHVTFRDMHMTRAQYTVSQGTVVAVGSNYVDLDIHNGFPMPDEIIRWSTAPKGMYLRRYTASLTDPLIITDGDNLQVQWLETSYQISGQRWHMIATDAHKGRLASYQVGEYVGIKSKHTGNTWYITNSDDIVFENVKWTHSTRGKFRNGTSNVRFSDCEFVRSPPINGQTPCLSSPAGGPQMGHEGDPRGSNFVVERCYIEGTGDDCVGIFDMDHVRIEDCVFSDGFARGILLVNCTDVILTGSTIVSRGPIQIDGGPVEDTVAPAKPTGLSLVDGSGHCQLSWNPNTESDLYYYQIYRQLNGVWWEYAITTDTFYDDLWALNGTAHNYYIQAVDTSGNHSTASAIISEPPDYAMWVAGYGLTGSDALETADPEPDGFNNYMEYALEGNPTLSDASDIRPTVSFVSEAGTEWMEHAYRRRNDYVSRGLNYVVESSMDLLSNDWNTNSVIESGSEVFNDSLDIVTNRVSTEGASQQYMRLRVE